MKRKWSDCKNILCIRADNMGDLIMSTPAIRAIKETFNSKITVLTSSLATGIVSLVPFIDDVITFDLPWIKTDSATDPSAFFDIINTIREGEFDAAIIFTVFSQNPLPAAMLAYLAGIPKRLAYCRENPYELLTDWVPEKEPYTYIRHQVERDINLVQHVGAVCTDPQLSVIPRSNTQTSLTEKLSTQGISANKPWMILHAGVSEKKRELPAGIWIETGKKLIKELGVQLLLTGSKKERKLTDYLADEIGTGAYSVGGLFSLHEFVSLIDTAPLVISVNTGTVHIAAAVNTPVIVLYALTNPQHTPWMVSHKVFYFDIPNELKSKNEVLRYVYDNIMEKPALMPSPAEIVRAAKKLMQSKKENASILAGSYRVTK
jgi:lipopolysaccharide heptosyltransferase II